MKILFYKNEAINKYLDGNKIVVTDNSKNSSVTFRSLEAVREYWKTLDTKVTTPQEHIDELEVALVEMEVNKHNCLFFGDVLKTYICSNEQEIVVA